MTSPPAAFGVIIKETGMAAHYIKGELDRVAFVFSCPGRYEEIAGEPAAKTTGQNLNFLIDLLSQSSEFLGLQRKDCTITNSWSEVEYPSLTDRSEATDDEILSDENLVRLKRELPSEIQVVVCFGEKAKLAVTRLDLAPAVKVLHLHHLSTRGLNSIKSDVNKNLILSAEKLKASGDKRNKKQLQNLNTKRRIEVAANTLLQQMTA